MTDQELLEKLLTSEGYGGYRIIQLSDEWMPQQYDRWWKFCDKTVGKYVGSGTYYSYKRQKNALVYIKKRLEQDKENNT